MGPAIGNGIAVPHVNCPVKRVGVVTKTLRHFPFLLRRILWMIDDGISRLLVNSINNIILDGIHEGRRKAGSSVGTCGVPQICADNTLLVLTSSE